MVQMLQGLPSKQKALSSKPPTAKKKYGQILKQRHTTLMQNQVPSASTINNTFIKTEKLMM
jgi:hypothetical protein